jgi:mycothiol synthase
MGPNISPKDSVHVAGGRWCGRGDQVAGMVLNYFDARENREYRRNGSYTETICVRHPWRRRGLARALLAQSFRVLQEQGLTEAALSADAENPSGALRLYTSTGFIVEKQTAIYRKRIDANLSR